MDITQPFSRYAGRLCHDHEGDTWYKIQNYFDQNLRGSIMEIEFSNFCCFKIHKKFKVIVEWLILVSRGSFSSSIH